MGIPKSFEFPFLIVGNQSVDWLKQALSQIWRVVLTKDDKWESIDYIWIAECLHEDREEEQHYFDAEALLLLWVNGDGERTQAFVEHGIHKPSSNSILPKSQQIIDKDEYLFVILYKRIQVI